jgi:predicted RNA-binding Zn-ribbon protein involved in translation (DUF1610 family)
MITLCEGDFGFTFLVVNDDGRDILIQTDWDYPGTANTFGWSTAVVQKCGDCGKIIITTDDIAGGLGEVFHCEDCEGIEEDKHPPLQQRCDHLGTDGTVDCKACGITNSEFLQAAGDWLSSNIGAQAEDPGYFE